MFKNKKAVIWDLDNTLYRITPEFADRLDLAMAEALVLDLGVNMSVADCKNLVKESYRIYRDGGEFFTKTTTYLRKIYSNIILIENPFT